MPLTITEALAEIKTINKRLVAKRNSLVPYLARQDNVRDPMEKDGGSASFISRERQALSDLQTRIVVLRRGIQHANDSTTITIGKVSKTISEWLTWRREIAPEEKDFLNHLRSQLNNVRDLARKQGVNIVQAGVQAADKPTDLIVNISESDLLAEIENFEEILGTLDGQLSLKNATVMVEE